MHTKDEDNKVKLDLLDKRIADLTKRLPDFKKHPEAIQYMIDVLLLCRQAIISSDSMDSAYRIIEELSCDYIQQKRFKECTESNWVLNQVFPKSCT